MHPESDSINKIIMLKEASVILGISEGTLRTGVLKEEFINIRYKKSG